MSWIHIIIVIAVGIFLQRWFFPRCRNCKGRHAEAYRRVREHRANRS